MAWRVNSSREAARSGRRDRPGTGSVPMAAHRRTVEPRAHPVRHVVITVHGIRTFGDWQLTLEELLRTAAPAAQVYSYNYGYFDLPSYTTAKRRKRQAARFRDWLLLSFLP